MAPECSLLMAEGVSCSLDVLYGVLGISKLQFLIKRRKETKYQFYFFSHFLLIKPLNPYPVSLEMLDPDPYPSGGMHLL